jgi:hypothetical protein
MWLGAGHILTGTFRYYNVGNESFPDIGHYFAWIHVLLQHISTIHFTDVKHYQIAKHIAITDSQGDQHRNETQSDDESHIADSLTLSSSPTDQMDRVDDYHVAGDIVHVRLSYFPVLRVTHLSITAHPNRLH